MITNTYRVVFFDMTANVKEQFVADVDAIVDGPAPAGDVAASHQAGLQPWSLKKRRHVHVYPNCGDSSTNLHLIVVRIG